MNWRKNLLDSWTGMITNLPIARAGNMKHMSNQYITHLKSDADTIPETMLKHNS